MHKTWILAGGLIALAICGGNSAHASEGTGPDIDGARPGVWTMDFEAAKVLAARTQRPLLLNFTGSDWCAWCKLMDRQVFSLDDWRNYAKDHWVLVWIDFPRDSRLVPETFAPRNQALSRRFEVRGYPTYVLLDPDGQTVLGRTGASASHTPESFIQTLDLLLLTSDKSVAALREKMTPVQREQLDAARAAMEAAIRKLEDWIQTQPERTEPNTALFEAMNAEIVRTEEAYLALLKAL